MSNPPPQPRRSQSPEENPSLQELKAIRKELEELRKELTAFTKGLTNQISWGVLVASLAWVLLVVFLQLIFRSAS
jgi:hypothetical protein